MKDKLAIIRDQFVLQKAHVYKMYYVKCSCIMKFEQNLRHTKKQQGSLVWSFLRNSYKCMAGVKSEWALLYVVTLPPHPQEGNSYWDVGNSDLALICFWHPLGATIQGDYYSWGHLFEGGRLKKSQKRPYLMNHLSY